MSDAPLAYLLKKFPRLSETFVLGEILGQEALETPVRVIARRPPDDEPHHPQLANLRAPVELLPGTTGLDPWRELFVEDAAPDVFERLGTLVRALTPFGHPRLHKLVAEALYLRRRCEESGVRHLHVHFATDSAVVAHMIAALGGPSYSITAHAKDIYRSTIDRALLSRVIAGSAFTVTVCDANVRHLSSILTPEAAERVRRLYNGIDLDTFRLVEDAREPDHILAVGRLVEKKGFDVLLEALALLAQRGVAFRATIVGDGDQRMALRERAARLDLCERVNLAGPLDQGEVRALMSRATLMALPCVIGEDGNRDALPTVLLEALAVGLPCVSTPVTGIPEILDGGRVGALVPERDAPALADELAALLEQPERRVALARAGRVHAERNFDARTSARILGSWLRDAVGVGAVQ